MTDIMSTGFKDDPLPGPQKKFMDTHDSESVNPLNPPKKTTLGYQMQEMPTIERKREGIAKKRPI